MDVNERAEIYHLHAEFCKTLSDANRLLIISELAKGELSVSDLIRRVGLQQSNASKHLALLRDQGLVNARRDGTTIFYSLSDFRVYEAISLLRAVQSDQLERRRKLTQINTENLTTI